MSPRLKDFEMSMCEEFVTKELQWTQVPRNNSLKPSR